MGRDQRGENPSNVKNRKENESYSGNLLPHKFTEEAQAAAVVCLKVIKASRGRIRDAHRLTPGLAETDAWIHESVGDIHDQVRHHKQERAEEDEP